MKSAIPNIRLSDQEIAAIKRLFQSFFDAEDALWIFGSRVKKNQKGGDIDLYIQTKETDIAAATQKKLTFISELKSAIGDQKIDVVLHILSSHHKLPIYDVAQQEGVRLI